MTGWSRSARALTACALLLATGAPARAAHPEACSGTWPAKRVCYFSADGLPVSVGGDAIASGTARVRVYVTVNTPNGPVPITECSASGQGYARCTGELGPAEVEMYAGLLPLECRVEGTGSGSFACSGP